MEPEQLPRIAIGFDRKISDGNYGSIGATCILSGITVGMTRGEIAAMMGTADIAFSVIREDIEAKIADVKGGRQ